MNEIPCCCSHFLKVLTHNRMIEPDNLTSQHRQLGAILKVVHGKMNPIEKSNLNETEELYGRQPFLEPPNQTAIIREAIQSQGFRELFQL